jgi:ABC-type transport system involved in cytochrome c biogenesis permease subunit
MDPTLHNISRLCFGASYFVAFLLELARSLKPRPAVRVVALAFGAAGLVAHTLYLLLRQPSVAAPFGSLLLLAWVVAVFYFYGTLHHRGLAWAVFVLPLALALIAVSVLYKDTGLSGPSWFTGETFWGAVHGGLLFLAAVGVCVGCVASVMYLVQARRLKAKSAPGQGLRLLSLERLAQMNRRAITWAFPLLTAGLLLGVILMAQRPGPADAWTSPRILGTVGLWLAFLVLLYLRYFAHSSNRRLAFLTIAAFALLVGTLATAHPVPGVRP